MVTLNTVVIHRGKRFGKDFSGTFQTREFALKVARSSSDPFLTKLYCPILIDNKTVWIAIDSEKDVSFKNTKPKEIKSIVVEEESQEAEDIVLDRLKSRFDILRRLVLGVCHGAIRALVISGPAGVGKSHGVETELEKQALMSNYKYEFIKGTASAIYIYQKLWEFKDEKSILVFDDCDSALYDPIALNLFKAALDSSKKRTLTWGTNSRILKELEIDNTFEFRGSVIFITNLKFDKVRSESLRDHLAAIESRCHYLDLTIDTSRDKLLRIKQVVRDSDILKDYGFQEEKTKEILDYISHNVGDLRELSLRTIKKVADLALYTEDWKMIANTTCQRTRISSAV